MRALVTGGCGFIGTNLIKRLSNNNHKEYCENIVVSIDDYSTGSGDNEIECNGVQYFGGDISKVTDYSITKFLLSQSDNASETWRNSGSSGRS